MRRWWSFIEMTTGAYPVNYLMSMLYIEIGNVNKLWFPQHGICQSTLHWRIPGTTQRLDSVIVVAIFPVKMVESHSSLLP